MQKGSGAGIFLALPTFFAIVFYLLHWRLVAKKVWTLLANTLCLFIAILWFNAFDDLLDYFGLVHGPKVVVSLVHVLLWMAILYFFTYCIRVSDNALTAWSMIFTHATIFALVHVSSTIQVEFFASTWWNSAFCVVLHTIVLVLLFVLLGHARTRIRDDDDEAHGAWHQKMTEMEHPLIAATLSFLWTQVVLSLICGTLPLSQDGVVDHTSSMRTSILLYSFGMVMVAFLANLFPGNKCSRPLIVFRLFLNMCAAWGVISWANWQFDGTSMPIDKTFGEVLFALGISCVSLAIITVFSACGNSENALESMLSVVLGLLIADSWVACFKSSLKEFADLFPHPSIPELLFSFGIAIVLTPAFRLVMVPRLNDASNTTPMFEDLCVEDGESNSDGTESLTEFEHNRSG